MLRVPMIPSMKMMNLDYPRHTSADNGTKLITKLEQQDPVENLLVLIFDRGYRL
jgi:hypothetical protein